VGGGGWGGGGVVGAGGAGGGVGGVGGLVPTPPTFPNSPVDFFFFPLIRKFPPPCANEVFFFPDFPLSKS